MSAPDVGELAATKLRPPAVPLHLVRRSRLDARVDQAIVDRHRLILLSAPAGSGKSTLLAGCLADRPEGVAWLQVEDSDADPVRFWTYLTAALERTRSGIVSAVAPTIASSGGDPTLVVTSLVNALSAPGEPVVVVVDDYHLVDNPRVHRGVERLVELAPDDVRVVIATRSDPPFRLGRLRVRRGLTEIRADDLRFEPDEAADLLAASSLDRTLLDELCARTEGWAAGLVLASVSLARLDDAAGFIAGFRGDDQLVVDYLTDELLSSTPSEDRRRMLRTSILDRLTGPLVDVVAGGADGAEWLARTADANQLLVRLDRTGVSFRYHHLLRDVLRLEARRAIPDELPALHRAAADWHREHGDVHTAIEHYIAGGDLLTAGDLIAVHATALLNGGQIFTVLRLLDQLGDLPERHSRSALVRGWTNLTTGRFAAAKHYHEIADRLDDGTDAGLTAALGMMVHLTEGDVTAALAIADRTVEPSESTQAVALAAVNVWAGRFDHARPYLALARELAASEPSDFAAAVAPGYAAVMELECGHVDAAGRFAAEGLDHAATHGIDQTPQLAVAHAVVARTARSSERRAVAAERAVELARRAPEPLALAYALASAGDRSCADGEAGGAQLLREADAVVGRCTDPGIVGPFVARTAARHGVDAVPRPETGAHERLTEREVAVLRFLGSSLSQREIASELFVSLNTVKTHCKAIYRKLGVSDRQAAVHAARRLDVI